MEFVSYLNRASEAVHDDIIYIDRRDRRDGVEVEVAFQYCGEYTENVHSYVNNINTIDGGTHVVRLPHGPDPHAQRLRQEGEHLQGPRAHAARTPRGPDGRRLASALPEPQFEAQTKAKLSNREIEGIVNSAVGDFLAKYLEENPKTAKIDRRTRAVLAAEARESGPQGPGPRPRAQGRPEPAADCPANSATAPAATSSAASCTWSRAIRPAAAPRAAASASTRPSSPCAARSSTPTSRATTRCWPTRKSAA